MGKKQFLNSDVQFDEVDNNYLPVETEFDEIETTHSEAKKKYTRFFPRLYRSIKAAAAAFYQSWKQA